LRQVLERLRERKSIIDDCISRKLSSRSGVQRGRHVGRDQHLGLGAGRLEASPLGQRAWQARSSGCRGSGWWACGFPCLEWAPMEKAVAAEELDRR
jgi:hypothetical protein